MLGNAIHQTATRSVKNIPPTELLSNSDRAVYLILQGAAMRFELSVFSENVLQYITRYKNVDMYPDLVFNKRNEN